MSDLFVFVCVANWQTKRTRNFALSFFVFFFRWKKIKSGYHIFKLCSQVLFNNLKYYNNHPDMIVSGMLVPLFAVWLIDYSHTWILIHSLTSSGRKTYQCAGRSSVGLLLLLLVHFQGRYTWCIGYKKKLFIVWH